MSHCFVLGATKFEVPNLIWMVKIVVIFGNRKLLIDGDQIEIDEIEYILGDQNHKIERNQNNLY